MAIGETFLSAFLQLLFENLLSTGGSQFLKMVGGVDLPKTIKKWKIQHYSILGWKLCWMTPSNFKGGTQSGIDSISFSIQTGFRLFFITRVFTDCCPKQRMDDLWITRYHFSDGKIRASDHS